MLRILRIWRKICKKIVFAWLHKLAKVANCYIWAPLLSQLFEHAWPATFLPELIGYKPGYPSLFIRNQGESLSIRVCGTFHHPFVATQGRPNFRMTCASAKRGNCRNFFALRDFQNAGYNHDTNLSHFPGLNRYHQVGNHLGSWLVDSLTRVTKSPQYFATPWI